MLLTVDPILLKHITSLTLSYYWPDIENPGIPTSLAPKTEPEEDTEECIPQASNSNSSSSQFSQISCITKNDSSPVIDSKTRSKPKTKK